MSLPRRDDLFVFLGSWVPELWLMLGLSGCGGESAQPTLSYAPGVTTHADTLQVTDLTVAPLDASDTSDVHAPPIVHDAKSNPPDAEPVLADAPPTLADVPALPDVIAPPPPDAQDVGVAADEPAAAVADVAAELAVAVATDIAPELPVAPPGGHAVCDPCSASVACSGLGTGAACVGMGKPLGATGFFCAVACSPQGCPSGYTCAPTASAEGNSASWCLPTSAPCSCSAAAIAAKWTTKCFKPLFDSDGGVIGQCGGVWSCKTSGDPCSAELPTSEVCDGKDNDCDGLTDEQDAGSALCDDGDPCTTGDACVVGKCVPGPDTCGCKADAECLPGANLCLGTAFCDKAQQPAVCGYKAGSAVVCPPSISAACGANVCEAASGLCKLAPKNEGGTCNADGSVCTPLDHCVLGACEPGAQLDCEDSNVCTTDSCDGALGCVHAPNTSPCDADGSVCTAQDHCASGKCLPGTQLSCDDGNVCTTDSCDAALGCVHTPNTSPCDADGSVCTAQDHCAGGKCLPGTQLSCDDGNVCTTDSCDGALGCVHAPNTSPCDADGSACTAQDHCAGGKCLPGKPVSCPGSICMGRTCNPASGQCEDSKAAADGTLCLASTPCLSAGKCLTGACIPGVPPECGDGNPCTDDACSPGIGCVHNPNSAPCNDNNLCTAGDVCSAGACKPGAMICECQVDADCAPKNPTNLCDGTLVCSAAQGHVCVIKPETVVKCPPVGDGVCESAACAPATGACYTQIAAQGTACSDGNACTTGDGCSNGLCQPAGPVVCNDKNPCTVDACDPISGTCTFTAIADCGVTFQKRYGGAGMENFYGVVHTADGGFVAAGYTDSSGAGMRDGLLVKVAPCGDVVWQQTFGGAKDDQFWGVTTTHDGGYIACGESASFSGSFVVRTDADGKMLWQGRYGAGGFDYARKVLALQDGGFLLLVEQYSFTTDPGTIHKGAATKIDKDGAVVWSHAYGLTSAPGGAQPEGDAFFRAWELADGNLLIGGSWETTGYGDDDYTFTKLDGTDGSVLWTRVFGTDSDDEISNMAPTSDGGWVITGHCAAWGAIYHSKDIQVSKFGPDWKVQWTRRFGGFDDDRGYAVFEVPDGYVAMGRTSSFGASKDTGEKWTATTANPNVQYDAFFAKLSKSGTLVDFKVYGNASTQYGFAADGDGSGGFLIAGQAFGFGAQKADGLLIKVDGNGDCAQCDTTDVPLGDVSQATGTLKTKFVTPFDFGAAIKLPSSALQYGSELLIGEICGCK